MNTTNESPRVRSRRRLLAPATAVALALTFAACGSDDDGAEDDVASPADTDASGSEDASAGGDDGATEAELQQNGPITVDGEPLVPFDAAIPDDSIGATAPLVSGESFDGSAMSIGGATDTATMVVFLAHWCPHCNDEIPELLALDEAGSLPDDLEVIAVSTAVDPSASNYPPSEWLDEKGWTWAAMADDDELTAISAFGGTAFPFTVILDENGDVLARRGGSAPADVILEFIDDALA